MIDNLFKRAISVDGNLIKFDTDAIEKEINQAQTSDIFGEKWEDVSKYDDVEKLYEMQRDWFLKLYGFNSQDKLVAFLKDKKTIVDTGCGLGYKAAWMAKLAPHAIVIGIDISDAVDIAAKNFSLQKNLFFLKADIANTCLKDNSVDFVICDQVIMHTEVPENTFKHLSQITSANGEFACYVYSKKALPRELVDDYFRTATHNIPKEDMWAFSSQLTELGKNLTDLKVSFDCPDIPLLGIKGGTYDVQRFIYWNFLKCFWKEDWSFELNKSTNFDWYAPSNAKRFSRDEFLNMGSSNNLKTVFETSEEACHTARFAKK
jgi:ubiquinone/menaquinone biosynthesis C-methylase UbiE